MRGLEGGSETWVIGFGTGVVLTSVVFFFGCGGEVDGDSPKDEANHTCEEAWVIANDGDTETINDTEILVQPWCQQHLAERQAEEAQP